MRDNKNTRLILYFIPAVITSFAFFQGDTTLAPPLVRILITYFNWICFAILFFINDYKKNSNFMLLIAVVLQFLVKNLYTAPGLGWGFSGVLMTMLLCMFCFLKKTEQCELFEWFRKLLIIISVIGIVAEISFLTGLGLPYEIVDYYDDTRNASYVNYYFSYLYLDLGGVRLCGLFNEAGFLGTLLGLTLLVERYNLKKVGNIIMLIAGCLTLSITFFIFLFIGIFFNVLNCKKCLLPILLSILVIALGISIYDKNHVVSDIIKERTTYDSDTRSIGGHSREESSFQQVYKEFQNSDKLLFGYGTGYCSQKGISQSSSIRLYFVDWGYLGTIIIYGFLLMAAFLSAKDSKRAKLFVFCFILSILQRPGIFSTPYFIVLFGGIQCIILKGSEGIIKDKYFQKKTVLK